jgi:uncharacterized protein YndB with AHSA1/START domain
MSYELQAERVIDAPPGAVLDGFIDMYGPDGQPWIHHSDLDLRVGGSWTVGFGPPGPPPFREDRVITAYQPGRLLAYSVTATYEDTPPLHTEVELHCEPHGEVTRVTLTQRPFPSAEQRDEFANAWHDVLDLLAGTVR